MINQQNNFLENIDYSEEWLLKEIFKTDFEQKETGKEQFIKMKKIDLLNLVLKFIKLNRRGE